MIRHIPFRVNCISENRILCVMSLIRELPADEEDKKRENEDPVVKVLSNEDGSSQHQSKECNHPFGWRAQASSDHTDSCKDQCWKDHGNACDKVDSE